MWDEISHRELPHSKLFVVFWSKNYVSATGCIKEIVQAEKLVEQGRLKTLIIRLDDYPIFWSKDMAPESKVVFDALKPMLSNRTSSVGASSRQAITLIQRAADPILGSSHPLMVRAESQDALRRAMKFDRFTYYPVAWVSGFNGVGRQTLITELNRNFVPNGRAVVVDINEASLPQQVRLRLESEAFGTAADQLKAIAADASECTAEGIAQVVERVFAAGDYVIFRQGRIVEENVELPEWLDQVFGTLERSTRPKAFIVSQIPLGSRRAKVKESLVSHRVSTIDEVSLTEYAYQLIGYFDSNPGRWGDAEVEGIVRTAGGTIGFLVSLVRSASRIEDFDQIDQLLAEDNRTMTESITTYVRWAFSQLREFEDEQRALLFLNDVSPCDINDLERVVKPKRSIIRVLGKLLDLGLIERDGDGLYKLTPLLSNRLSRDLLRSDLLAWMRKALVDFVATPVDVQEEEHSYIKIEARIQASMLAPDADLPPGVVEFVSASHWFQAGIRLYHAKRREPAYRILSKAYARRADFAQASRTELIRYFCLSATRNRKYVEAEEAIKPLDSVYQTKGMAAFLRADILEHQQKYVEAARLYEQSVELNSGKESRVERTYRPLIKCILASPRPDFRKAEKFAKRWLAIRRSVFSLRALADVYLQWKFRGYDLGFPPPENIDSLYAGALSELADDPGVGSAHFEVKSDEAEFSGDFEGALSYMNQALLADPRFELRVARWRIMSRAHNFDIVARALSELDSARANDEYRPNWLPFLPSIAEIYARCLKVLNRPMVMLNNFAPELNAEELKEIVRRAHQNR